MQVKPEREQWKANEDILPGVFLEILWDIEEVREEGRRRGERIVRSIWWRAEVLEVQRNDGKVKLQLRYESKESFEEQVGEVWIFSRHVRIVGDDNTQLRWRYYEFSGDVKYDMEDDSDVRDLQELTNADVDVSSQRLKGIEDQLVTVIHQYEALERLVLSQNKLFSRLMGTGSQSDRISVQLFASLRQKLAVLMQKPIPPLKSRKDCEDGNSFYEDSCAGCLTVDVDCDLEAFQAVSRVVKSKVSTACFRPSFAKTQCPPPALDELEILLSAFKDIADVIGISSSSDLMQMAIREKGRCKVRDIPVLEGAIRVVGTCVIDTSDDKSPVALLVCKSINEGSLMDSLDAFIRDTREFDFTSRAFRKRLEARTCTGRALLKSVFASRLVEMSEQQEGYAIKAISSELRNFTLRWRPITSPSSRMWTRSLAVSEFISGILELEIPFVIFRGPESVAEMKKVVSDSFIMQQLRENTAEDGDFQVTGT